MIVASKNVRLWYLSGGMTKFGPDEYEKSNDWREYLKNSIYQMSDGAVICFNPNEHFNLKDDPEMFTDREAMNFDIHKLKKSELVIYNNNDPYSRGSMIELGIAYERQIPIFTLNENDEDLHPWVKELSERIFKDGEEILWYLSNHYICVD